MDLNELTKKYKIKCGNCEVSYTIKYDEESTDMKPMSCPFCSYEVDEDQEDNEVNDDEGNDSWN
tara:strand:+ start:17 stop:208 length:192 start_codon:yes stop_codon:yes gene_type:complete